MNKKKSVTKSKKKSTKKPHEKRIVAQPQASPVGKPVVFGGIVDEINHRIYPPPNPPAKK